MISYQKLNRWLEKPVDPITVEDWLANREIFGPTKDELEKAYQTEINLSGATSGEFIVNDKTLFFSWTEPGEAWIYGEKVEKIKVPGSEITTKMVNPGHALKIKANFKNLHKEWVGSEIEKIIFDIG